MRGCPCHPMWKKEKPHNLSQTCLSKEQIIQKNTDIHPVDPLRKKGLSRVKPYFSVIRRMKEIRCSDRLDLAYFCLFLFSIFPVFWRKRRGHISSFSARVACRRQSDLEFSPAFLFLDLLLLSAINSPSCFLLVVAGDGLGTRLLPQPDSRVFTPPPSCSCSLSLSLSLH